MVTAVGYICEKVPITVFFRLLTHYIISENDLPILDDSTFLNKIDRPYAHHSDFESACLRAKAENKPKLAHFTELVIETFRRNRGSNTTL